MKRLDKITTARDLVGILISLSIGFALILFNARISRAHGNESQPLISKHIRAKVQEIYTSQIGVREKKSNSGPEIENYLRYVHLSKGNPWCAAFVCWVLGEAGISNPKSGWSPALFGQDRVIWERGEPRIKSHEPRLPPNVPSAYPSSLVTGNRQLVTPGMGDIFGLYFPEKKRIAHVGFIDLWDGTWMISVEGNTNLSGSREGVCLP